MRRIITIILSICAFVIIMSFMGLCECADNSSEFETLFSTVSFFPEEDSPFRRFLFIDNVVSEHKKENKELNRYTENNSEEQNIYISNKPVFGIKMGLICPGRSRKTDSVSNSFGLGFIISGFAAPVFVYETGFLVGKLSASFDTSIDGMKIKHTAQFDNIYEDYSTLIFSYELDYVFVNTSPLYLKKVYIGVGIGVARENICFNPADATSPYTDTYYSPVKQLKIGFSFSSHISIELSCKDLSTTKQNIEKLNEIFFVFSF
ncbi:MAG: hypothetical protein ABIH42_11040 [Planctomycetota bacterium]